MGYRFLEMVMTPAVQAAQEASGSAKTFRNFAGNRDFVRYTPQEVDFIHARDSFYLATVSETGWPYVQHRGGPPGFLRVIDDRTLACADFRGNRQYITVGNLATEDRACLFLMDYPNQRRLKIFVTVELRDLGADPELAKKLATPGYRAVVERAFVFRLAAFDWNCPQHITPRYSQAEFELASQSLLRKIAQLEAEKRALEQQVEVLQPRPGSGAP
jgi:uncharacterized protein